MVGRSWRQVVTWCALGGGFAGLSEALHVVFSGRLGLGVPGVAALALLGIGTGVSIAAVGGLLMSTVSALRTAPNHVFIVLGFWLFVSVGAGAYVATALPFASSVPWAIGAATAVSSWVLGGLLLRITARRGWGTPTIALIVSVLGVGWGIGVRVSVPEGPPADLQRPNVLFVTLSGVRDDVFDRSDVDTPTFDRLVREGTRFTAATAPGGDADLAAAQVLTLSSPNTPDVATLPTLATLLTDQGYGAAAFVSSPMPGVSKQDFGVWDDDATWPKGIGQTTLGRVASVSLGGPASARMAADVVDRVARFLDVRQGAWFVWVHLDDATPPFEPPVPFDARYLPANAPRSADATPLSERATLDPRHGDALDGVTAEDWVKGRYLGEVAYIDRQLQELLRVVDTRGWSATTLVVVMGLDGSHLAKGDVWFGRGDVLDLDVIDVPAVLRLPGVVPVGRRIDAPIELADLTATWLDLLGLVPPAVSSATSMAAWFDAPPGADVVARSCTPEALAVRSDGVLLTLQRGSEPEAIREPGARSVRGWSADDVAGALAQGCGPLQPSWSAGVLSRLSSGLVAPVRSPLEDAFDR